MCEEVNVGSRYIEFYLEDEKDARVAELVQNVARALEDEMHQLAQVCEANARTELNTKMFEIMVTVRDVLAEFGHQISLDELNDIFAEAKARRAV